MLKSISSTINTEIYSVMTWHKGVKADFVASDKH